MANIPQRIIHEYLRHDKKFPHVWCSGCSNGIVLGAIIRAIASMNLDRDDIVMVSGIGCPHECRFMWISIPCTPCMDVPSPMPRE